MKPGDHRNVDCPLDEAGPAKTFFHLQHIEWLFLMHRPNLVGYGQTDARQVAPIPIKISIYAPPEAGLTCNGRFTIVAVDPISFRKDRNAVPF